MNRKEKLLHKKYDEIENNPNLSSTEKALKQSDIISQILVINQKYNPFRTKRQAFDYYRKGVK